MMNVQARDRNPRVNGRDVVWVKTQTAICILLGSHLAAFCITRDINVGIAYFRADMMAGSLGFQRVHYRGRTVK
jgi:hypothetical protein